MEPGDITQARMQPAMPLYLRTTDIRSSERNVFIVREGWIAVRIHSFRLSTLLDHDKFIARNHGNCKRTVEKTNTLTF
jgi:hypothetical protein